jgi:hypothetical protein
MKSNYFLGKLLTKLTGGWPMITAGMGMVTTGIIYTIAWIFIVSFHH